ncbi:MAG: multidrug effflux MFS transporter [Marinicaulis sp.]|nr:multidrug effflux MFS transporter [Marinicaulis sp.]
MAAPAETYGRPKMGHMELVAIIAAVMALNALAIDMMLPALGIIGDELGAAEGNDRQRIIVYYVLANGVGQLIFGPLVDRFGRRPVLIVSLIGYVVGSALSIFASTFSILLAARAFQGIATAAARVSAIAIVRDQCSGRKMAQVMSLAITIFMAAPILAPSFGQLIMFAAPWRGIFVALLLYGLLLAMWITIRVPETMAAEDRKTLRPGPIINAYLEFIRTRQSIGYTVAGAMCFGALFGYISTSEQIFLETFKIGGGFGPAFAVVAGALGAATLTNARIVHRYGMRRITHTALLVFIITNLLHLSITSTVGETFLLFMIFTSVSFFCLGFIGPNASALAMDPMGHNAGPAAAANGFFGTTGAGYLGGLIGSYYDGTTMPIIFGFCILGVCAFAVILWTEKGRLFHAVSEDPQ